MPIDKIKHGAELVSNLEQLLQDSYRGNEAFNDAISGEETFVIPSLKDSETQYNYTASEILYWVDRTNYLDELESWDGENIKSSHQEALNYLASSGQVSVFEDLVELIRKNRVAPFLGAGISRAANYPLWGEALRELVDRITTTDNNHVEQLLSSGDYLGAAQYLFNASEQQLNNYVQTTFRVRYDNDEQRLAIPSICRLLPRLSSGCIVTTNFDRLIEEVFRAANTPLLDGYMYGVQQDNNFVQQLLRGDRCILKLHGDAPQPSSYVFTRAQYEQAYGDPIDFSKQLPRALRQIYISNSLLFLGCSLASDKTLELFKQVKDSNEFEIPDHFAILSQPDDASEKQQTEDRLLNMKIRPIWYTSEDHHAMATKLVELAVDVADKRLALQR